MAMEDKKVADSISTLEAGNKTGAKIAERFLRVLDLPAGPWSGFDPLNVGDPHGREKERTIAAALTNNEGVIFRDGDQLESFISRDPRHILRNSLSTNFMSSLDPDLAEIFENELEHSRVKQHTGEVLSFAYVRFPGGIDCVLKGYLHHGPWQEEHGGYLSKTARKAKVICLEGVGHNEYGESLYAYWKGRMARDNYSKLMHDAVDLGFDGLFAEVDVRNNSTGRLDNERGRLKNRFYPILPDKYYEFYMDYLRRYFPGDAAQIRTGHNLKELLRKLSTTQEGLDANNVNRNIENINIFPSMYVDKDLNTSRQMTGYEYGEHYFSDAMAAIKLHLIADEMRKGKIDKGVIVDFEGVNHLEQKYFYIRHPYLAFMKVLRNPQLILAKQTEEKFDVSSVYPSFFPDAEAFERMFERIWGLETARLIRDKTNTIPVTGQLVCNEIDDRRTRFEAKKNDLHTADLVVNS